MAGLAATDIPLNAWGVHESRVNVAYLRRDAEDEVKQALALLKPVLILGSSMAGKTRMAAELVQELFPDNQVFMPDPPDGLANIMNAGDMPRQHVVWLDDLERYLQDSKNLKTRWIDDLQKTENVVIATMRANLFEAFMPNSDQPRTQWEILQCFARVYLTDESSESHRLASLSGNTQLSKGILDYGLGTYLGGGFLAVERLDAGRSTSPVGRALVLATIDWQRSGIGEAIPETTARALVRTYIGNTKPQPTTEEIDAGLKWSTAKVVGGGLFSLLEPTPNGNLRPFDYLVDHVASSDKPVTLQVWQAAAEVDAPAELLTNAGVTAQLAGLDAIASMFFERGARLGDANAMVNYAISLERQDRIEEAKFWDTRAAEAGNPGGLTGFAVKLLREGQTEGAEKLLRQAANAGEGSAMTNLGHILIGRGETAEGINWHKRAAEAGSPLGMTNYGLQLELQGNSAAAEAWYRKAQSKGDGSGAALFQLAMLAEKQGKIDEVEPLLREAVKRRNPSAMGWLGSILAAKGQQEEAEYLFQGAADRGGAVGLAMVGRKLVGEGKYDEAEKLFKRAIAEQLPWAITDLGVLYANTGRIEAAKAQYALAVAAGDDDALHNLGELLIHEGRLNEAQALFRKAADLGSATGMYLLSESLFLGGKTGDIGEAANLLEEAAILGDLDAICESGRRAADQGDHNKAFQRLKQAADRGHAGAAECLTLLTSEISEK
ncbi:tetratricopeptide repeat protein [Arthrobacter oryzae]|uniref:Tetratricopeptide repeat protein n=2 Tax=Arthrobacter oryzae TaxID=409290 RepID=A0A495E709_9MICC|nr:tetratricopeptide repeat protein [Arthrobacter oryzae]